MTERHVDTDIAIIGGGGAGIAAALEAKAAGARAVLLEQDDALGGTAATSGGGCFLVGTPLQESLGHRRHAGPGVFGLGGVGPGRGR